MAKKLYEESNISAIAGAIRLKNGSQNTYTVSEMADAIEDIETGGELITKSISENGTYNALLDDDADGYSQVTVNVQTDPVLYPPFKSLYNFPGTGEIGRIVYGGGRYFSKVNPGDAAVFARYNSKTIYTEIFLVSRDFNAAIMSCYSPRSTSNPQTSIEYNGITYYINNSAGVGVSGDKSVTGFAQKLKNDITFEEFLQLALSDSSDYYEINANGQYPVPSGYSGFASINVNIPAANGEEF